MTILQTLADKQDLILLAEIAGLLHNIGKLDPNFLVSVIGMKDRAKAKEECLEHLLDIPFYNFQRFAAPDPSLLAGKREFIVGYAGTEQADFAAQCKNQLGDHPFQAKVIKAAWWFNRFHYANGPLYRCFSPIRSQRLLDWKAARDNINKIKYEITQLDAELTRLKEALKQSSSPDEKRGLGAKFNELGRQKRQLEASQKDAQKQADERCSQVENAAPIEEQEAQSESEARFRRIVLQVGDESWSLADLLTLFWDDFFYQPPNDPNSGYKRQSTLAPWLDPNRGTHLPALLILSHGEVSGAEKEGLVKGSPSWKHLRPATAFGYEGNKVDKWALHDARHRLLDFALQACAAPSRKRNAFVEYASQTLEMGLGDTQWPINEINLWDYSTSVATLFKAAVAKAVMEDRFAGLKDVKWQLLSVRYDGLRYLSQAHHLSDLLARRDLLVAAHERVLTLIEVEYPLGNEVYRDENGAVLVVPYVVGEDGQDVDLLTLPAGDAGSLKALIETRFGSSGRHPLGGELLPLVALSQSLPGKGLRLHEARGWADPPLEANPASVTKWWADERYQGEICTVCGLRPMGYGTSEKNWQRHHERGHRPGQDPLRCEVCKAQSRSVCWVCMERREDRSLNWAKNKGDEQTHTIWTDEVADANGKFALLVGRFDLDGWLDGTLISSIQKPVSFARIRRVWDTTRKFWEDVEKNLLPQQSSGTGSEEVVIPADQRRLRIDGQFVPSSGNQGLGRYHIYELDVEGASLSVVWVPQDNGGYFLTADNLCYVAKQLSATKQMWQNPLTAASFVREKVNEKRLVVNEPGGYGAPVRERGKLKNATATGAELPPYTPFIPILAQPATFMALVPADRALAVTRYIKRKYETEMGRVRDRLPLHLGLVFAPRRTPLRAVLDAGRAMLDPGQEDWRKRGELWQVKSATAQEKTLAAGKPVVEQMNLILSAPAWPEASLSWSVSTVMGDNQTPDRWYPHLLTEAPHQDQDLHLKHVTELATAQQVWVRPSTFDFVFLDTTGRRFELNYAKGRRKRFYLEQLDELETLWHLLAGQPRGAESKARDGKQGLTNTQIHDVSGLIEAKRKEWNVTEEGDPDGTFAQLVRDALAQANWPGKKGWARLDKLTGIANAQQRLEQAGISGTLARTVELHSNILKLRSQRKEEA